MILVTGAAGKTGRAVLRRLCRGGARTRALIRRPRQRDALRALGVTEAVTGNLLDAGSLAAATRGVEAVYHICPNVHPSEVEIARTVAGAAGAAGVRRFVYHSVLHPQIEAMPHHWAKMRVEELLLASDFEVTILQPAPYMQNVLAAWRSVTADGVYAVPYALETRVSMVDLEDVAEVAARALGERGHGGAVYPLAAPDLLDQRQVAATLADALERPVRARTMPRALWAQRARAGGLDPAAIEMLLAMFRYYERHGLTGNPNVLAWLLGRRPTFFADFAARTASAPPGSSRPRPPGSRAAP